MKKIIILLGVLLTACTRSSITKNKKYINSEGTTLETRILVPKGYQREQSDFAHFLQTYPLKENGSPVHLYVVLFIYIMERRNLIKIHRLLSLSFH